MFGSLADSLLYVAHPNVLVLFGGSVELVHLWWTGVGDEEHTSFVIGYVPHDEVVNGEDWRFVLDVVEKREKHPECQFAVPSYRNNQPSLVSPVHEEELVHAPWSAGVSALCGAFLPDMERCTSGPSPEGTPGCQSSVRPEHLKDNKKNTRL